MCIALQICKHFIDVYLLYSSRSTLKLFSHDSLIARDVLVGLPPETWVSWTKHAAVLQDDDAGQLPRPGRN